MVAPNIDIRVFDLSVYAPRVSGAIVGMVGPATKGPMNALNTFTDEGSFVNFHGTPVDGHYGPRGAIRYFTRGNQLNYVRIAGPNLETATLTLFAANGKMPILNLRASIGGGLDNPGTWANGVLGVSVQHNGTQNYNITVFFKNQSVEPFVGIDNGTAATRINNGSVRISCSVAPGAGATFPAETINPITGAVTQLPFSGGNDGAFASTNSASSSTGGVAGRRFMGLSNTIAGSRVWQNILTISPAQASKTSIRGSVLMPVAPGTFTIRVQTAGGPTFIELADNATEGYTPGAAGMGVLAPASSTHTGYIDYRTGAWGVKLASGTTFNGGTVDGIWVRATSESVGATAKGEGAYAGNISGAPCGPGFFNSNRAFISVPIEEQVGVPALAAPGAGPSLAPAAGGAVDHGSHDYAVVFVTANGNSAIGPITNIVIAGGNQTVNGTVVPLGPLGTTARIIVRSKAAAPGVYYIVTTLADNTTTVFVDAAADASLSPFAGGALNGVASSQGQLKTLAGWIIPGTVVLTPQHSTLPVPNAVYDDGFGGWTSGPNGTGIQLVGSINYRTGVYAVNFDPTQLTPQMPTAGTLQGDYDIMVFDMGGGAVPSLGGTFRNDVVQTNYQGGGVTAVNTDTNAQFIGGPILPGNVKIVLSNTDIGNVPFTAYDDGLGGWLTRPRGDPLGVAVTGTINYVTGAWTITPGVTINATSTVNVLYTSVAAQRARRALRGTGPQFVAGVTANAAGLDLSDPQASNGFDGTNYLDHMTGQFGIDLNLVPTGPNTFDVKDNGTLTAVYLPADILGFGDGTRVTFTGTLSAAPYRRQANRLIGFQGAQASAAGSGDPQLTFSALGVSSSVDYWLENVAVSTDPANHLDYRDGETSIKWTGAPLYDEATFVASEEAVLHITSDYPGDIGNERTVLSTGIYIEVGADPTLPGTLRLQVFFNSVVQESFGQANNIAELVTKVNDPINGSKLVTVASTVFSDTLPVDVTATQQCGMSGAFTLADVIGTKAGQTYTGMQIYSQDEVVPMHWIMVPGQWHTQVITAMQTLCEAQGRRAIGVIPAPDLDDPLKFRDFYDGNYNSLAVGGIARPTVTVPYPPLVAINSTQLATISPWVNYFDAYANANVWEPSDGDMMQRVAATPNPWQPIAGNRRGRILADQIRYSPSRGDRNLIYGLVGSQTEIVNTIIRKQGLGLILGGQRTAARSPTHLDRINVRWTVNVLMNLLDIVSQDFLFELNDSILWREAASSLNRVLAPVVEARGLQDVYVTVDGTTTTPDDVDNLTMNAKLYIKPALATEYIVYDLILTPTGANFADLAQVG